MLNALSNVPVPFINGGGEREGGREGWVTNKFSLSNPGIFFSLCLKGMFKQAEIIHKGGLGSQLKFPDR